MYLFFFFFILKSHFYLNKLNLAIQLTFLTGKPEVEQVKQLYQPSLNYVGVSSMSDITGTMLKR